MSLLTKMPVEISHTLRSKRKTLALIVKPDGSVIVRAPLRASEKTIREFVQNHSSWIQKKRAEFQAVVHPLPRQYVSGELFMYLGQGYPLEIVKRQKSPLLLEENFRLRESARAHAARVFERWYREQARHILEERVNDYARQYALRYQKIGITSARTRWGSCSATGSLNFSWRLIMAPIEAVDYVVVHELVHTIIHDHSKHFWKKVEEVMPDFRDRRLWLRKNGSQLVL